MPRGSMSGVPTGYTAAKGRVPKSGGGSVGKLNQGAAFGPLSSFAADSAIDDGTGPPYTRQEDDNDTGAMVREVSGTSGASGGTAGGGMVVQFELDEGDQIHTPQDHAERQADVALRALRGGGSSRHMGSAGYNSRELQQSVAEVDRGQGLAMGATTVGGASSSSPPGSRTSEKRIKAMAAAGMKKMLMRDWT